jgi:hypothetical protein
VILQLKSSFVLEIATLSPYSRDQSSWCDLHGTCGLETNISSTCSGALLNWVCGGLVKARARTLCWPQAVFLASSSQVNPGRSWVSVAEGTDRSRSALTHICPPRCCLCTISCFVFGLSNGVEAGCGFSTSTNHTP